MANLDLSADHNQSSAFDLDGALICEGDVKRTRKAKVSQQQKGTETKFKTNPDPSEETPTWQSVISDAEEQMARLRRTIEWTKKYARSRRLGFTTEPSPSDGTRPPRPLYRASDI